MKKAYVKPVFLAEEFVGVAHVANACGYSISEPAPIYNGVRICTGNDHHVEHSIGKLNKGGINGYYDPEKEISYWEYAGGTADKNTSDAYLFTTNNGTCDFLWRSSDNYIGVWNTVDPDGVGKTVRDNSTMIDSEGNFLVRWVMKFSEFFYSNESGHTPGYESRSLMS